MNFRHLQRHSMGLSIQDGEAMESDRERFPKGLDLILDGVSCLVTLV
jgi:hypothetical protein